MTPKKYVLLWLCIMLAAALAGCASDGRRAPVVERGVGAKRTATAYPQREAGGDSQVQIIEKGDTLYSIAFSYGLDYRELAAYNNIENPEIIYIGQKIRIPPPGTSVASAVTVRVPAPETVAASKPLQVTSVEWPLAVRLNYSPQAVAQVEKLQVEIRKSETVTIVNTGATFDEGDGELEWAMPVTGKLLAEFSESANRKGIDIAGKLGQPVAASAAGKVVYSGSGLRGYGKLVIIKHNKAYLSAYAHNDQVLVKEGQNVSKGQKIATMGDSDADQVKLHFEIRKFGKPVNPAKYLPL